MKCEDVRQGSVVRSLAGRNKGRVMCVIKVDEKFVYAADGKEYSSARPKRKNKRHIEPTGAVLEKYEYEFDSRLRKALNRTEHKIDS